MIDIVIPARLESKRFPKKLLFKTNKEQTLIEHLVLKLLKLDIDANIHVLTDSKEIIDSVFHLKKEINLILDKKKSNCGTERISNQIEAFKNNFILNIQADEGLSDLSFLPKFIEFWLRTSNKIITPIYKINEISQLHDVNCVKVAKDQHGKALYFSRQAIPFLRDIAESEWLNHKNYWGHMGIYGYKKEHLQTYKQSQSNCIEDLEKLEQLRFLSLNIPIMCYEVEKAKVKSVDCIEDTFKENKIISHAKNTLIFEALAIKRILPQINSDFLTAVKKINCSKHHLIFSGLGKSALVAKKICASLNSISVQSLFINPVDAFHGDLGMVSNNSVCLLFSNSGKTKEILDLAIQLKKRDCYCIAITGQESSALEKICDQNLNLDIQHEADPLNLVPTSSTTSTLALGDAILSALIERRKITEQDFLKNHSSGTLGHLLQPIATKMHILNDSHVIHAKTELKKVSEKISRNHLGAVLVVNEKQDLLGIITDGDIRRAQKLKKERINAEDFMTQKPVSIQKNLNLRDAISLMQNRKSEIAILPVFEKNVLCGLIRLHDILGKI